ncbi:MAG: pseudomurein-binding repeat-containing protein [Methanobacteriaceae archaeon]|nr:pseudomurein-binding repeat-containing protein [Methanobacteriaceae archaeon]MDP3485000.1 pseudomurein-binding repeat-containing protein [Methanobacteriaceae archaeon]
MPIPSEKICPNCRTKNDEEAKFCEKCGTPLKAIVKNEGMSSKNKILIIICIILVIVLGVAVGVMMKNSQEAPNVQVQNESNINSNQISNNTGFPVSEAPNLANKIYYSTEDFKSITYGSTTLDKNQCIYILAKSIVMIDQGKQGTIPINSFNSPDSPQGYITDDIILKTEYVDMAKRTYTWMDKNGITPNYVGIEVSGQPDISPDSVLNLFAKVLAQYKSTNQLPSSVTIP